MRYLLDVNVLVAWGWQGHEAHTRVDEWIAEKLEITRDEFLTSAIPQLGFVRVSVQLGKGRVTVAEAGIVLKGMLDTLDQRHMFLPDDQWSLHWPKWCQGARMTTDAHLATLAHAHGGVLATLDEGIPGAHLIGRD